MAGNDYDLNSSHIICLFPEMPFHRRRLIVARSRKRTRHARYMHAERCVSRRV